MCDSITTPQRSSDHSAPVSPVASQDSTEACLSAVPLAMIQQPAPTRDARWQLHGLAPLVVALGRVVTSNASIPAWVNVQASGCGSMPEASTGPAVTIRALSAVATAVAIAVSAGTLPSSSRLVAAALTQYVASLRLQCTHYEPGSGSWWWCSG